LKKSLSQGRWHVLAPLFIALAWQGKVGISMRLSRKRITDAANLAVLKKILDIAGT
jgi:hypothetical protein